jgi:DNA-binding GntR family transcriptional regulator
VHLAVPQSLHDRLTGELRDMIVERPYSKGHRLVEADLCRKFGVSRTPMREALKVLAGEGLVDLRPNRGACVTELSPSKTIELFAVVAELEALAAALTCERITPAQIEKLESLHGEMLARRAEEDLHQYFALNEQIHNAIVALSGNSVLAATHQRLLARARRTRFQALHVAGRWDASIAEHEALMEALRRRRPSAAQRIWREHVRATGQLASDSLLSRSGGPGTKNA